MRNKIKISEDAKQDLKAAIRWYESQEKGVGKELAKEVVEKIEQIGIKPKSYSKDSYDVRKSSLKKFPYLIFYIIKLPFVLIIAIWHKNRNQEEIFQRSEKVK